MVDVGGPEGDNVGFARLEVKVGGERDFVEDERKTRREQEKVVK